MSGVLHVRVTSPYEAECAEAGGADRLILTSDEGLSPLPETVTKIRAASTVEMRVVLRLREGYTTDGGEIARLRGLASTYIEAGVDGFVFGFLTYMAEIDDLVCVEVASDATWAWTFDRAVDATLDPIRAQQIVESLPRVDSIMTAGSAREIDHGIDRLIARAADHIIAAGGLKPEHIPWLVRGGLTQYYIDTTPITTSVVSTWRRLIDDEMARV
ncbi:MAG: copper homeostasis protein CutC [Propionibacteriaceae bacterium]|jgi:copper homeostasis protein|nr:copper homeostasis protein CutC [Propionibacteriaceae bacterium]